MNGADGYTPERGKDYWTEEDRNNIKDEAVQDIQPTLEEYQKQIEALEAENKKQQEELDILNSDYKEATAEGETAVVSDGLPKSKIKADINGNSYQETTENSPSTEEPSDIEVITECSLVQRGKNIYCNVASDVHIQNNDINYELIDNNTLKIFTTKSTAWGFLQFKKSGFKKGQKYKFSCEFTNSNSSIKNSYVLFRGVNTGTTYFTSTVTNGQEIEFTPDDTEVFVRFNVTQGTALENTTVYSKIQISEIGGKFEPYIEPIVHSIDLAGSSLAKVTLEDNLIIGVNGSVNAKKITKEYILTGDETSLIENYVTKGLFQITLDNVSTDLAKVRAKSNYLKSEIGYYIISPSESKNYLVSTYSGNRIFFKIDDFANDLQGLKAWLKEKYNAGEPMKILYELATPEVIDLPSISPITLFEGTNVFELVTNLGTTLAVTYKVSNKKKILNLEERISALESAVIGG